MSMGNSFSAPEFSAPPVHYVDVTEGEPTKPAIDESPKPATTSRSTEPRARKELGITDMITVIEDALGAAEKILKGLDQSSPQTTNLIASLERTKKRIILQIVKQQ